MNENKLTEDQKKLHYSLINLLFKMSWLLFFGTWWGQKLFIDGGWSFEGFTSSLSVFLIDLLLLRVILSQLDKTYVPSENDYVVDIEIQE